VGILYISTDKGTQWRSLLQAWIKKGPSYGGTYSEEQQEFLQAIFKEYCYEILKYVKCM